MTNLDKTPNFAYVFYLHLMPKFGVIVLPFPLSFLVIGHFLLLSVLVVVVTVVTTFQLNSVQ
jgi:hypothetical protein